MTERPAPIAHRDPGDESPPPSALCMAVDCTEPATTVTGYCAEHGSLAARGMLAHTAQPGPVGSLPAHLAGPPDDFWQAARMAIMRLMGGWSGLDGPGPGWDEKTLEQAIRRGEVAETRAADYNKSLISQTNLMHDLYSQVEAAEARADGLAERLAAAEAVVGAAREVRQWNNRADIRLLSNYGATAMLALMDALAALDAAQPAPEADDGR